MLTRLRRVPVVGFVLVLALLATPLGVIAADDFEDVPDSNTFHDDISWLAGSGVTRGCNPPANTRFCPSANVTREQMAAFLKRLAEGEVVNAGLLGGMTLQQVLAAGATGVAPPIYSDPSLPFVGINRDTRITGNEVFGITYDGAANDYGGMYVETSHPEGWPFYGYATDGGFRAWTYYNPTEGKWKLYNSGQRLSSGPEYGLEVHNVITDGVRIYETGDDGIQIGLDPDYPNYGLYIPSPGVSAYGLWPNTTEPNGEWALYTVDRLAAGNATVGSLSLVAQVGAGALDAGDVVAAAGVAEPLAGGTSRMPLVVAADGGGAVGVIGVVESRMVFEAPAGKDEPALQRADGPARPGDYVSLVVYGVADVKVAGAIGAGDRLTAADSPGAVRRLETRSVEGMEVAEGAPVIGVALEAADGAQTVPVFVSMR